MKKITLIVLLLICNFLSMTVYAACQPADYLLTNAMIYTVNPNLPTVETVGVLGEKIVFVGSKKEAQRVFCKNTKRLDLNGATVFPGFTDSHQHLQGVGRRTKTLSLFGIPSLAATLDAIKAWAEQTKEGDWVLGRGWIEREWTDEQRFLTKHDVDPFTKNKPLYMPRADGVSALVNSAALKLAGIDNNTADPVGGKFERDENGELTGYVLANAMKAIQAVIPQDSDEYLKDNLKRGMQVNAKMGWTQTHDAGMSIRLLKLLESLHEAGEMQHRVYVSVPISEAAEMFKRGRQVSDDDMLEVRGIKVFIDGTLGSRGAALIEKYADADHHGFMNRTTKKQLMPVLREALIQGVQIQTHVIGDRAVKSVLDWYDEARTALPKNQWAFEDLRWRLEHAQIITPKDQQRLVDLDVLPSMQPSHGIGDLNFAPARLGKERLAYAYPWQSLVDKGLKILAGSDAPVEVGDPRIEFYAAVARKRLDGTSEEGWHPEQAVSRETALKMLTLWPAYGAFQAQSRGSIEVGKYADFTIFNKDLMQIAEAEILTSENIMTIVHGKVVYQKSQHE